MATAIPSSAKQIAIARPIHVNETQLEHPLLPTFQYSLNSHFGKYPSTFLKSKLTPEIKSEKKN